MLYVQLSAVRTVRRGFNPWFYGSIDVMMDKLTRENMRGRDSECQDVCGCQHECVSSFDLPLYT